MIFLADFNVLKPEPGLLVWTSVIFLLFWFLMSRFAFKPIGAALKQREIDIQSALDEAKRAREEMSHLQAQTKNCWHRHVKSVLPFSKRQKMPKMRSSLKQKNAPTPNTNAR